ncbi:hypothetical protein JCM8097_007574 [Rhodosporidiobolus ruineniae]
MNALVLAAPGKTEVRRVAVPQVGEGEILVKTAAVALNPADHKSKPAFPSSSPSSAWLTLSPPTVRDFVASPGDRVAGFVAGGLSGEVGAFAEYVKTEEKLVWRVPEGVKLEKAAAAGGGALWTAIQVLYSYLHLSPPSNPITTAEPVLVWGGSTSVGLYAVQLLNAAGYTVVATASEKNFATVEEFGAHAVFSHSDPDVSSKISSAFPSLSLAFDCYAEHGSDVKVAKAIVGAAGKGHVVLLNQPSEEVAEYADRVKVKRTVLYTILGQPIDMLGMQLPARPEERELIEKWLATDIPALFISGKLKSNPVLLGNGGLGGIAEGLEYLKAGKVSAQKLVYTI